MTQPRETLQPGTTPRLDPELAPLLRLLLRLRAGLGGRGCGFLLLPFSPLLGPVLGPLLGLHFGGLVAMEDPPRPEVFEAVAACPEIGGGSVRIHDAASPR